MLRYRVNVHVCMITDIIVLLVDIDIRKNDVKQGHFFGKNKHMRYDTFIQELFAITDCKITIS